MSRPPGARKEEAQGDLDMAKAASGTPHTEGVAEEGEEGAACGGPGETLSRSDGAGGRTEGGVKSGGMQEEQGWVDVGLNYFDYDADDWSGAVESGMSEAAALELLQTGPAAPGTPAEARVGSERAPDARGGGAPDGVARRIGSLRQPAGGGGDEGLEGCKADGAASRCGEGGTEGSGDVVPCSNLLQGVTKVSRVSHIDQAVGSADAVRAGECRAGEEAEAPSQAGAGPDDSEEVAYYETLIERRCRRDGDGARQVWHQLTCTRCGRVCLLTR